MSGKRRSKLESVLEEELARQGVGGWEHSPTDVPGSPDLCRRQEFPPVAVFLDGCFWHGCPEHYKSPGTRKGYWRLKVLKNRIRDRGIGWPCRCCGKMNGVLPDTGWVVVRVWEHEVRDDPQGAARRVIEQIRAQRKEFTDGV